MKYLAVDYGTKRVGLSLSDATGVIAFPLETVANDGKLVPHILNIVEEKRVGAVVVGDTRAFGGGENTITEEMERFVDTLASSGVKVERAWEAGSSIEASRYAPEGESHNDAAAAAVILQRYIDMHSGTPLPDTFE
jgi:putative Holliday junction resolvase